MMLMDNMVAHQEYNIFSELGMMQILEEHPNLPLTAYLGAAGMPGTNDAKC
jgi:NADPH-dependent curcumin reductase CurA